MYHTSQNNFLPYYKEYPFKANSIREALSTENIQDDVVISVGEEQIEALMTLKPFDPEDFGFKAHKIKEEFLEEFFLLSDNAECFIKRGADFPKNYWLISFKVKKTHTGFEPFDQKEFHKMQPNACHLFIPHDMAGRMILTGLGIIDRVDLENGKGCENDEDCDGVCPACEDSGTCTQGKGIWRTMQGAGPATPITTIEWLKEAAEAMARGYDGTDKKE